MTSILPEQETPALLGGPKAVPTSWEQDWPIIEQDEIEVVVDLMKRRVLSIYDRSGIIAEFEDAFAKVHQLNGVTPYALSHSSGTSALHAAYFGVGIGPGDEVIVPTYTFLATVMPILQCCGIPIFADMDRNTLTLDPNDVEQRITSRTQAVVVTHMWGHPADMERLVSICEKHNLALIEDCSHAHGATYRGQLVGTFGDVGCFSLEGHKAIVAGEGGILITKDRRIYERALLLGHFGRRIKDEIQLPEHRPFLETGLGHKYRMHPLAAGIALVQLGKLFERNEMRRRNLDYMSEQLKGIPGVEPPVTLPHVTRGGFYGYKPRFIREEIPELDMESYLKALIAEGVQAKRPGSKPLHLLPTFQIDQRTERSMKLPWAYPGAFPQRKYQPGSLPVAEAVYPTLISLPTFTIPSKERIDQYAVSFRKVARHTGAIAEWWRKELK